MANLATADRAREFPPVAPTVHKGGTGALVLYDNLSRVVNALRTATNALWHATPNGRDYLMGSVSLELAKAQHERRLGVIQALIDELTDEMELVSDQID